MASKRQQRDWLKLFSEPGEYAPRGYRLKQWLFGGQQIATEVALFPLQAYKGQTVADLFGERSYFADADQFWTLQSAAIAAKRDALLDEGWADVEVLETGQRFCSWEHEKTPKSESGRVYLTLSHGGEVEVHEGWLTAKEAKAKRRAKTAKDAPATDGKPVRPELTNSAQTYIELHRHAAVRHALLGQQGVALRLMVAHAIGGSALWQTRPDPQTARKDETAESLAKSMAEAALAKERKTVLKLLGLPEYSQSVVRSNGDDARVVELFAALLKLPDDAVLRVLAVVMAETLEAGTAVVEALGTHLKVDMRDYWQADEAFFDLLRDKAAVNALLRHIGGKRVADANVTATTKIQKKDRPRLPDGRWPQESRGLAAALHGVPLQGLHQGRRRSAEREQSPHQIALFLKLAALAALSLKQEGREPIPTLSTARLKSPRGRWRGGFAVLRAMRGGDHTAPDCAVPPRPGGSRCSVGSADCGAAVTRCRRAKQVLPTRFQPPFCRQPSLCTPESVRH